MNFIRPKIYFFWAKSDIEILLINNNFIPFNLQVFMN